MLSNLLENRSQVSTKELKKNTISSKGLFEDDRWKETEEDVVTVCINESLTHQERYEYRKNRTYSQTRPRK
jgi:flagellar basal body L-ring protein FlgH